MMISYQQAKINLMHVPGIWTSLALLWLQQQHLTDDDLLQLLLRWQRQRQIPLSLWQQALQRCVALQPQQSPELAIGARITADHLGKLGYLVQASATMQEALHAYQRYEPVFYGEQWLSTAQSDDRIVLSWPVMTTSYPLADAVAIAALVSFIRQQLGSTVSPLQVSFVGQLSAAQLHDYREFFQCPVLSQQTAVTVTYPLSVLATPMPWRDPVLQQRMDQQVSAMLKRLPKSSALEQQLQQVLLRLLVQGEPSLVQVARALHLSSRTLQRRLQQHGLSWQQWLDQSRVELAGHYFQDPTLSNSDIALLLGFSEQSAFNRAYRRCTGTSPAKARRYVIQSLFQPVKVSHE